MACVTLRFFHRLKQGGAVGGRRKCLLYGQWIDRLSMLRPLIAALVASLIEALVLAVLASVGSLVLDGVR